jgi:hypothetical protein
MATPKNTYGSLKSLVARPQGAIAICGYAVFQNSKDFITIAPTILGLAASQ